MARLQRIRTRLLEAEWDGYLTVFLSLSLTIILSLVLTLIEGARTYAVRMQAECVVMTAMDSCLAEFNKELENRYNLFLLDTSYGGGSPSQESVAEHMKDYMSRNLEVTGLGSLLGVRDLTAMSVASCEIVNARYACDNHGEAIREQIEAYMTAGPEAALASNFAELFRSYEGLDEDAWQEAYDDSRNAFEEELEEALDELEDEEDEREHDEEGEENLDLITEILDEIQEFLGNAFLTQVLGSESSVSDSSVEGADLLEDRDLHYGSGYQVENSHHYSEAGSLVMMQYIMEKCANYREKQDDCALQYEAEYIVFGERTDHRNLERMTERLVMLRAAADLAAIHGVSQCTGTVNAIAVVLNLFLGIPASVTRELILVIWSYAEAIQDVKTLYQGGKVPIVKSSSNWQTSLSSLTSFGSGSGTSQGSGLDYGMYLRFMLLTMDITQQEVVTERLMNVMEQNVTKTQGTALQMDWCLDAMKADVTITSGYGSSVQVIHEITYN